MTAVALDSVVSVRMWRPEWAAAVAPAGQGPTVFPRQFPPPCAGTVWAVGLCGRLLPSGCGRPSGHAGGCVL